MDIARPGPDGKPEGGVLHQEVTYPNGRSDNYTISNEIGNVNFGPRNPKNSIKARIISNNIDDFVDDDDLRVYWPMFPGVSNPSAGEVVYVVFEDTTMKHGLWLSKAPLNGEFDTPNQVLIPVDPSGKEPLTSAFQDMNDSSNGTNSSKPGVSTSVVDRYRLTRKFIYVPK